MTAPLATNDRRRQFKAALPLAGAVVVFGLALFAIQHVLAEFELAEVAAHLRGLDAGTLAAAFAFSALAYVMLTLYDLSAMAYVGVRPPYRTVALGSFVGYALSNNVGFMVLSGGAVRYRIYSAAGLSSGDIARIVIFCTSTFSVGVMAVGGGALLVSPEIAAPLLRLPPGIVQLAAGAGLAALVLALALASVRRRPLRLWRWSLEVPGPRLLLAQIAVSSAEIAFSAAILWVLLPDPDAVPFAPFLAIYAGALVVSVLSHVPGGLGVFESIILVGLAGTVPPGAALGALVAYRVFYFVLPLVLATALLAVYELIARRRAAARAVRWFGGWAPRMVPGLVSAVVFAAGVALLVSGATVPVRERLEELAGIVPPLVLEAAHFVTSLIGFALLFLARGLFRRLTVAYALTMTLLAASCVLTLAKEATWEEAAALGLGLLLLAPFRSEFHRRTPLRSLRLTPGWIAAVAGGVMGAVWLAYFIVENTQYARVTWWRFALDERVPLTLRLLLALAVGLTALGLWRLTRPAPYRPHLPDDAELGRAAAIAAASDQPDGGRALTGDRALLFSDSGRSVLPYAVSGEVWIGFGDPMGPAEERAELIWRFQDLADRRGGRCAFVGVAPEARADYEEAGFTLGDTIYEARVAPAGDVLDAPVWATLRDAARRAERAGVRIDVHPPGRAPGAALLLAGRMQEVPALGLGYGHSDPDYLARVPVATASLAGAVVAVAPLWRGGDGAALDKLWRDGAASADVIDLLLLEVLRWAGNLGAATLAVARSKDAGPGRLVGLGPVAAGLAWVPRHVVVADGLPPWRVSAELAALSAGRRSPDADTVP